MPIGATWVQYLLRKLSTNHQGRTMQNRWTCRLGRLIKSSHPSKWPSRRQHQKQNVFIYLSYKEEYYYGSTCINRRHHDINITAFYFGKTGTGLHNNNVAALWKKREMEQSIIHKLRCTSTKNKHVPVSVYQIEERLYPGTTKSEKGIELQKYILLNRGK